MICTWELEKVKDWTTNKIKNCIWGESIGQPIPGCVSGITTRRWFKN